MTILDAINQTDGIKFNTYSQEDKVRWLYALDARVAEFMQGYEAAAPVPQPYTAEDMETVLLLTGAWEEIYIRWLETMIDYSNAEMESYNRSVTLYDLLYQEWKNWYARNNMPVSCGQFSY